MRNDFDMPRNLEVGHLAPAVFDDRRCRGSLLIRQLDKGEPDLPEPLVGNTNDDRLSHKGIGLEYSFYLRWICVRTTDDEHILGATKDCEVALRVKTSQVSRFEPAVRRHGLFCSGRNIVVANH